MGRTDSPLTDLGRRQADAVAARLSRVPIAALYSSDLGRAVATAEAVSSSCGQRVVSDSRLREQDLGRFEGMGIDEIQQAFSDLYAEHKARTPDTAAHGGESAAQVRDRVMSFIDEVVERHLGETLVVVTHGGVMAVVFWTLLETPFDVSKRIRVGNTGVGTFPRDEDGWTLECWNDMGHLDDLLDE